MQVQAVAWDLRRPATATCQNVRAEANQNKVSMNQKAVPTAVHQRQNNTRGVLLFLASVPEALLLFAVFQVFSLKKKEVMGVIQDNYPTTKCWIEYYYIDGWETPSRSKRLPIK